MNLFTHSEKRIIMKDAKFMTADEKGKVLKQWIRFIRNGFQLHDFTDKLYKHLSLHCSFIAHYNLQGFYHTYFEQPETTAKFLTQFDRNRGYRSVEYGGYSWINDAEYSDLNQAMCDAIEPYKARVYDECRLKEKITDIRTAKALLSKHGIEINPTAA